MNRPVGSEWASCTHYGSNQIVALPRSINKDRYLETAQVAGVILLLGGSDPGRCEQLIRWISRSYGACHKL